MEIKSKLRRHNEQVFDVVYKEDDYLNNIEGKNLEAVHAFCFYKEKLIVVYADNKGYWAPPRWRHRKK